MSSSNESAGSVEINFTKESQATVDVENTFEMSVEQNVSNEENVSNSTSGFALTPAEANKGLLDLSTKAGIALYSVGVKALPKPFDGNRKNLTAFLDAVKTRVMEMSWSDITTVLVGDQEMSIIEDYGCIPMENVFIEAESASKVDDREKQDRSMLGTFLVHSITPTLLSRVKLKYSKVFKSFKYFDGPLILMAVLSTTVLALGKSDKIEVDKLRSQIISLPSKLKELKFDVPAFEDYTLRVLDELARYGQTSTEIRTAILKAGRSLNDQDFRAKVRMLEDDSSMDPRAMLQAMTAAYAEYSVLPTWMEQETLEEKVVTLSTQLLKSQEKVTATETELKLLKDSKQSPDSASSQQKNGKSKKKSKRGPGTWPKPGDNNFDAKAVKSFAGRKWYWCDKCAPNGWRCHTTDKCSRKKGKSNDEEKSSDEKKASKVQVLLGQLAELTDESDDAASK